MIATPASDRVFRLAEGPVWDDRRQRLLWVDITAGELVIGRLDGHRVEVQRSILFSATVSAVAMTENDTWLVAAHGRLALVGVTVIDHDLTLANGMAWSADGSRFYSVDTMTRTIRVRRDSPTGDALSDWSVFATLERGYPDGVCIDADAPRTSSVTFAGPARDVLIITTASDELDPRQRAASPRSGCLFIARPGVRGVPARRVAASVISALVPTDA